MPKVIITQDVEGKKAGATVNVPAARADWLVAEGYAYRPKLEEGDVPEDATYATSVTADKHPMLAENREKVNDETPTPDGDGNAAELTEEPMGTFAEQRARQEAADKESAAVVERTQDLLAPEQTADEYDTHIGTFRAKQAAADEDSKAHLEGAADATAPEQIDKLPRTLPRDSETKAKARAEKRSGGAAKKTTAAKPE